MSDDLLEDYLDRLLVALLGVGSLRQARHQLAEAEAHLRDSADEGVRCGLSIELAEREAVDRFGDPALLAAAERERQGRTVVAVLADAAKAAWWLGGLGAAAVGVSGLLAWVMTAAAGATFTSGKPTRSELTPGSCARWLSGTKASDCATAATADWAHDVFLSRVALGVVGLLALAAWLVWQRRGTLGARLASGLPPLLVDATGALLFGSAGLWLAGQSIDSAMVASGQGVGQWLSAAPVALAIATVFVVRVVRDCGSPAVRGLGDATMGGRGGGR